MLCAPWRATKLENKYQQKRGKERWKDFSGEIPDGSLFLYVDLVVNIKHKKKFKNVH